MAENVPIEEGFVKLVLNTSVFSGQNIQLSEEGKALLLGVVISAGFEVESVVPGILYDRQNNSEWAANATRQPINSVCQYKVLGIGDKDDFFATGWLNCLVQLVLLNKTVSEEIIKQVREEIEKSRPLKPILLTPYGEMLVEYPPSILSAGFQYFVKHTSDSDLVTGSIGVHETCEGFINRKPISKTHDALCCRNCHLRIPFPNTVKTYGDLRKFFDFEVSQST